jgi:hypothetical protein
MVLLLGSTALGLRVDGGVEIPVGHLQRGVCMHTRRATVLISPAPTPSNLPMNPSQPPQNGR